MKRHSEIGVDKITYKGWLIVDARGGMRLTRDEPDLKAGERKVRLSMAVAKSIFQTPELSVKVIFNKGRPTNIEQEVSAALADLIGAGLVTLEIGQAPPVRATA